jgi:hypothetical protein
MELGTGTLASYVAVGFSLFNVHSQLLEAELTTQPAVDKYTTSLFTVHPHQMSLPKWADAGAAIGTWPQATESINIKNNIKYLICKYYNNVSAVASI